MAPVVNLDLTEPVNLMRVAKVPALTQMRTLVVRSKSALSDDSVESFAASPLTTNRGKRGF